MAQVLWLGDRAYSDFRFKGRRIKRALRDETGNPVTNDRDAQVALGKMISLVRSEGAGLAPDAYPWTLLKERLLEQNERGKKLNGLKRDRVAFGLLERFFLQEYQRPLSAVDDVNREVLAKFMAARRRAGLHAATIKREGGSIKAAMRWAEDCQPRLRRVEDWRRVPMPKVGKRRPPHHSRAELAQLLRSLPAGRWLTVGWLGARAGLRPGEQVHLQPQDLVLERGREAVSVVGKACDRCAECRDAGNRWEPKDVDEREIPMPGDLAAYLRALWPVLKRRKWVLDDARGKRPSRDEVSTYFARLTRKAGLTGGPNKLRATWVTHMLEDGVPSKIVQLWAGHESLATTEQYTSPGKNDAAHIAKARAIL